MNLIYESASKVNENERITKLNERSIKPQRKNCENKLKVNEQTEAIIKSNPACKI